MFTATKLQVLTYLLGVCLFSIAFLVFLNSSVSFVITSLIGQKTHVGDAVGTLGFVDELVALLACPAWGVISDQLGTRTVCVSGYAIIGIALFLFVQARNIYPQLLLVRVLFSVGGSAASTMVTAILPSMITPRKNRQGPNLQTRTSSPNHGHGLSPSVSSELTITPNIVQRPERQVKRPSEPSPTHLAGIVGFFTGCGALIALGAFLRLPESIQRAGVGAGQALMDSYRVVGALALIVSLICLVGLQGLNGEDGRGWKALSFKHSKEPSDSVQRRLVSATSLLEAALLGFKNSSLGLGYIGGFVARASSVGISLFIPLFVNTYYISSGICDETARNPQDIKDHCRGAYVLAAELTGISQLVALIFAPIFGLLADKYGRFNVPILLSALLGVFGYIGLAVLRDPRPNGERGTRWIFALMGLLGTSQIGAIVCSLGLVGQCILGVDPSNNRQDSEVGSERVHDSMHASQSIARPHQEITGGGTEEISLLQRPATESKSHLKGAIAGIYSLVGGVGILLLTKVGGLMFDKVSPSAPFYLLAGFNGLLLIVGIVLNTTTGFRTE